MNDPYENYPQNRPVPHPGTSMVEGMGGGADKTPLCPWCNQPMESTGQYREIDLDGGEFTVMDEVYECRDCDYDMEEN